MLTGRGAGDGIDGRSLVSTIVIFLDAEEFLEEAIESVLAQTYDRWELLLVDDGSTDGGTAIARRYVRQHPGQVRYLEHPGHQNRGISAARNLGIRYASGQYVAFLDADDVWLPAKLEQQVALMERHTETGMICGATLDWYSWSGRAVDVALDRVVPVGARQDAVVPPPALLTLLYPLGRGRTPSMSNFMVRRQVIEQVGGFEESFRGLCEDHAFLTKVYLTTPVFVAAAAWDKYRHHSASCCATSRRSGKYYAELSSFTHWLEHYLTERGHGGPEMRKALRDVLWPYRHPVLALLAELYHHPIAQTRRMVAPALREMLPAPVFLWLQARFGSAV